MSRSCTTSALHYPVYNQSWLRSCLDIILPSQCRVCLRPLRNNLLCYRCRPPLPDLSDLLTFNCSTCFSPLSQIGSSHKCETCLLYPPLTDRIRFLWEYQGLPRDLIRTIKYRPSISLATAAGQLLRDALPHLFQSASTIQESPPHLPGSQPEGLNYGPLWDCIVPVPSSHSLLRKRLFHPCTELARPIANYLRIPVIHALNHTGHRAPQASLSHRERLRSLGTIFQIARQFDTRCKRILLIEDVITTGATISAAALTLRRAGAANIDVLALARTRVWSRFRQRMHEQILNAGDQHKKIW
ncbi:MAG: ComF family protein [Pseudomonadota bacterium]